MIGPWQMFSPRSWFSAVAEDEYGEGLDSREPGTTA